jgi:hypothetical protein
MAPPSACVFRGFRWHLAVRMMAQYARGVAVLCPLRGVGSAGSPCQCGALLSSHSYARPLIPTSDLSSHSSLRCRRRP